MLMDQLIIIFNQGKGGRETYRDFERERERERERQGFCNSK